MNIGQFHTVDNGNLNKTMKVILTNHNYYQDTNVKFLSYFNTTFNEDVAPGDYIWAPGTVPGTAAQNAPWRSMQIFGEFLDDDTMVAAFEPISSTNLTSAVYTATTIDNPAFGVKAGQRVEILLLQINSVLPTFILLKSQIQELTPRFVDLVDDIASSTELVSRIQAFLAS